MFKILLVLVLIYKNVDFELCNSNICLQRATHLSQGRRENVKITRSFGTFTEYFTNVLFFVFVVLVIIIELSVIISRYFSYVCFNQNLSLSCQSHSCGTNLPTKVPHELLTIFSFIYFSFNNPYALIFITTDQNFLIPTFIFIKFIYSLFVLNTIVNNLIFLFFHVNFRILLYIFNSFLHFSFSRPYDWYALWVIFLRIFLSMDIHSNPGPSSEFSSSFFSFCCWNVNSLSKDDFYRVSLLEANNTLLNYDIISLCETSLNNSISVKVNRLPGHHFVSLNNPDGGKNGGVGLFYKDSLPLKIRYDLLFDECLVSEMFYGRNKIFFLCSLQKS